MEQLTPDQITGRSFRSAFRGLDPGEVKDFLAAIAHQVADLVAQRDRLAGRLGEFAERDLKSEFAAVGIEVTSVLEAARDAAEGMRDRATADAARWRSEAMAEAEAERRSAREDAERLRSDAWLTSEDLLKQAQTEARRLTETAERDSLSVLGEAEREAHRLTASARRESEDLTRLARMEAERVHAEALARHDEIVESARRQADASQERARALEQRRQELLAELETLRSSLSRMEGELDERRTRLGLSGPEEQPAEQILRVVTPGSDKADWEPGETVRVVSRRKEKQVAAPSSALDEVVEDVKRIRSNESAKAAAPEPDEEPPTEPATEPEEAVTAESTTVDELGAIFSRLRGEPPTGQPATADSEKVEEAPPARKRAQSEADPFELQRRLVLPVSNRALRNLKRQLTEMQNQALEGIRVSEGAWRPTVDDASQFLRPELVVLLAESFSMGHSAAEELAGRTFPRPHTPARDEASGMAGDLVDQITAVLGSEEDGGRERSSALSRVFRAWRTDEAERRVNDLASSAYHAGLVSSLASAGMEAMMMVGGRGCLRCREAAEEGTVHLPPLHPGCTCTLVPAV
ncbi:MAG TPA: DivIVA domain-containing protein [Acidimicrobiia bacterium]|nr:DivIVA domain-containing protein [Acidimicrobiia bacterium]